MVVSGYSRWSNCSTFLSCYTSTLFIMHVPRVKYNQICFCIRGYVSTTSIDPVSLMRCSEYNSNQQAKLKMYTIAPFL